MTCLKRHFPRGIIKYIFLSFLHLLLFFTFNPCEVLPGVAGYWEPGLTLREWVFGRWQKEEAQGNIQLHVCAWGQHCVVCAVMDQTEVSRAAWALQQPWRERGRAPVASNWGPEREGAFLAHPVSWVAAGLALKPPDHRLRPCFLDLATQVQLDFSWTRELTGQSAQVQGWWAHMSPEVCCTVWTWPSSDSCSGRQVCWDGKKTKAGLQPWPPREKWWFVSFPLGKINNRLQTWDHLETKVFLHRVLVTL